jgi:hypothetical protein
MSMIWYKCIYLVLHSVKQDMWMTWGKMKRVWGSNHYQISCWLALYLSAKDSHFPGQHTNWIPAEYKTGEYCWANPCSISYDIILNLKHINFQQYLPAFSIFINRSFRLWYKSSELHFAVLSTVKKIPPPALWISKYEAPAN